MSYPNVQKTYATVAASQTDAALVAAQAGKVIRVLGVFALCGGTATTLVFNSKGSGAGTAISPVFPNGANGGFNLPVDSFAGYFDSNAGEAITCTTGAGSSTVLIIRYVVLGYSPAE
jgi:hypothetical protein